LNRRDRGAHRFGFVGFKGVANAVNLEKQLDSISRWGWHGDLSR